MTVQSAEKATKAKKFKDGPSLHDGLHIVYIKLELRGTCLIRHAHFAQTKFSLK